MSPHKHHGRHAHNLASLYALGALDATDRARFEAHIETCRSSVREVTSLLPVTHRLAAAVPLREAPAGMRDRVLRAVAGEAPPAVGSDAPAAGHEHAPAVDDLALRNDVDEDAASASAPRTRGSGRVAPWLVTLASLGAAGWTGWQWVQQMDYTQALQENLDAANVQTLQAEEGAATARDEANVARAGMAILASPDLETLHLAGQSAAPDASARWIASGSAGHLFAAAGLPLPPPGRSYQLWFVAEDAPLNGGMLTVDAAGRVAASVTPPARYSTGQTPLVAMAVTLEPEEGVEAPTGEVYLLGRP